MTKKTSIKLFESKKIRVHWDNDVEKWYFSIIDIIQTLTDSNNSRRYWSDLKRKLTKEGFNQLYEIIVQLKLESSDGKKIYDRLCRYRRSFENNTINPIAQSGAI